MVYNNVKHSIKNRLESKYSVGCVVALKASVFFLVCVQVILKCCVFVACDVGEVVLANTFDS